MRNSLTTLCLFTLAIMFTPTPGWADRSLMGPASSNSSPSASGSTSGFSLGSSGMNLENAINLDSSCLDFRVYGWCPYTDKVLISHYYPVALIELIRSPGDNAFGGDVANKAMASRTTKRVQNGFEVRIWDIGPLVDQMGQCMLCTSAEAQIGKLLNGLSTDIFSDLGGQLTEMGLELDKMAEANGQACGPTPQQVKQQIDKFNRASKIDLFYTTELDVINWRTGCRDLSKEGFSSNMKCLYNDVTGDLNGAFDLDIGLFDDDGKECVGAWGSVIPRQYRAVNTEVVSAAFTGWRGLHVSNFDLKNFKYAFSMNTKLQHAHPVVSKCFKPGRSAIFVEKDTFSSPNGNYAFIYWVPTACCRGFSAIAACQALLQAKEQAENASDAAGVGP